MKEVTTVVDGVSSCDMNNQDAVKGAFTEAAELGARFDPTVTEVHVGGPPMTGGKKKRSRRNKKTMSKKVKKTKRTKTAKKKRVVKRNKKNRRRTGKKMRK